MFSAATPTPKVTVLLESTTPRAGGVVLMWYRVGGKMMSPELYLDPGPSFPLRLGSQ